jgi:NADH:ubiquinone oxidoreductase subunit F (NADH-binding)
MVEVLERLARGEGAKDDMEVIEDLSSVMMLSSLCGLGQAASVPVLDTLTYFRKDYEARIEQSIFLRSLREK